MTKILIFTPVYLPGFKSGGPIRTIANMIDAVGDEVSFKVICLDRDLGDKKSYPSIDSNNWNQQGKAKVFYIKRGPLGALKLLSILRRLDFDIVHLNSFLSFQFSILPIFLLKIFGLKVPVILGPRGEFSQGALALKSKKKQLFIQLSKLLHIHYRVTWHASSIHEANDIRRVMGKSSNIRIATDIAASISNTALPRRVASERLRIVFISRISPMKNLEYAINILSGLTDLLVFDVYGPLEDKAYWKTCCQAAKNLPNNIQFNYLGSLQPDAVIQTLTGYDLFFLPTRGENFGHVIAEALFAGLPVLISDQTPWRQLSEMHLGWDLPLPDKNAFASAIRQCIKSSGDDYHAWRSHIKDWALQNIGNQEAINATRQLFEIK